MTAVIIKTRIAGGIAALALLLAAVPSMLAQQRGGGASNVQVLKDLAPDQLQLTMRFFAYSLGVECAYCHAQGDLQSDSKPEKITARNMIKMVMAINKDTFNGETEVTCYTCHRGVAEPARPQPFESTKIISGGTPPPAAAGRGGAGRAGAAAPEAAAAPAAPALPNVDAILAKYAQALGGEQALRKITSRTITGIQDNAGRNTQDVPWTQASFELYEKAPNLRVMTSKSASGQTTAAGFDGNSAWTQNANGVVAEASGNALARAKRFANFYEPLELKQGYTQMRVRGIEKVGDRDAYEVAGDPAGDNAERFYFDTQSGLLLRRVVAIENVVATMPTQTDYLDYRDAGGVKYPATIKIYDIAGTPTYTVLHVNKVDFSAPVDAAKFAKPESRPPAGRGGRGQ